MQEPRPGVVGREPDGDVVAGYTGADRIALDGVVVVVHRTASAADDAECMLQTRLQ